MARYTIPTICCTSGCPDSTCPTAACAWRRRRAHTSQPTPSSTRSPRCIRPRWNAPAGAILDALNPVRAGRGEEPLELITDPRVIEAGNEFRGKRIGHGKGALWRDGNWKLVLNLWKPSWGESYRHIAERVGAFANEKIREYAGRQIIVVSHESPIWSYRHLLETGHPEHWMFLRKTALASITSITYDSDTGKVMSITYADPAAQVE